MRKRRIQEERSGNRWSIWWVILGKPLNPGLPVFLICKINHIFPTHFSRDLAIKWSDWCQCALKKKYFYCYPKPELLTFLLVFTLKGRNPLKLQWSMTQLLSFKLQPQYRLVQALLESLPQARVSSSQDFGERLSREWEKPLYLH